MAEVALRPIGDSDLDVLFDQMRDPVSVQMAAFTAKNPNDREAFDIHMSKVRTSPDVTLCGVTRDGRLVGSIGSFVIEGDTQVTYWIDRASWGQGIASQALAIFLDTVSVRPLYARAASDNVGSLKVLQKAGFTIVGAETSYANARNTEIEETLLRLDQVPGTVPRPGFLAQSSNQPCSCVPYGVRAQRTRSPSASKDPRWPCRAQCAAMPMCAHPDRERNWMV